MDDASLIRLRFEHQEQDLGESELRPIAIGGGTYTITGSNLSIPGEWRIRMTIQRPERFDIVTDFLPTILTPPPPPAPPEPDIDTTVYGRSPALLLTGVTLLLTGLAFTLQLRLTASLRQGTVLLAISMMIVGVIFIASEVIVLRLNIIF